MRVSFSHWKYGALRQDSGRKPFWNLVFPYLEPILSFYHPNSRFLIVFQGYISLCSLKSMRYKKEVISLLNVPIGKTVRLKNVDDLLRAKLMQYGLHLGDRLQILRIAPLGGPLLVEVNGREVALGRAVADRIFVEIECESH
jgi:ferrous iron transport protein A